MHYEVSQESFEAMNSFTEHRYSSGDGLNLYYRDYAGPANPAQTLLCLPGLTRNARDFDELADQLATKHRVLCADLRGRGKSDYAKDSSSYHPIEYLRDTERLLNSAGVDQAVFIGTSLGGVLTMMAASLMRARVKAAVINDIGPVVEASGVQRIQGYVGQEADFPSWEAAAAAMRRRNAEMFPRWDHEDWMRMVRRSCAEHADGKVRTDYDKRIAEPFRESGPAPATDLWSLFEAMKSIPVLAIRGDLSDILSESVFVKMKARVPGLRQAVVPEIGHAPLLTEPEALAAIEAFLDSLP